MIEVKNVSKKYNTPDGEFFALDDITLSIQSGDIFGIIGMSGAGKSTLVRCINLLEKPDDGVIEVDGKNVCNFSAAELRKLRSEITMIFQSFNLLMQRNCLKNVSFPLEIAGVNKKEARERALELLDTVGLKSKAKAYPSQLSGGQQQRVAIARALATNPKVMICDEATSALDPNTTNSILELIKDINEKFGITVIVITHQMSVVEAVCKHVAILENGKLVENGRVNEVFSNPKSSAARRLVFPDNKDNEIAAVGDGKRYIRLAFDGADEKCKSVITRLSSQIGAEIGIDYSTLRVINGKVYGFVLLDVDTDGPQVEDIKKRFDDAQNITVQEVTADV